MARSLARVLVIFLVLISISGVPGAQATTLDVGYFSFEQYVDPDTGFVGSTYFNILNLTGDPSPDSLLSLPLSFGNAMVYLYRGQELLHALTFPDIPAQSYVMSEDLFPDFTDITRATFRATLIAPENSTFTASSPFLVADLWRSETEFLQAGDFTLLQLSDSQPVPEPSSLILVGGGLGLFFIRRLRQRN